MNIRTIAQKPWLPQECATVIARIEQSLREANGLDAIEAKLMRLADDHERHLDRESIGLNAGTNIMNPKAAALLARSLGNRPSLGYPGDKYEMGMEYAEEIEVITEDLVKRLFNAPYAERTQFGRPLVNSTFTLALITGMTVPDTSENAVANLAWTDIKLPKPVFAGDTLWAESEILELRESKSNPSVGIVSMRCRGVNQRREVVIEFKRTFMVYKRAAPEAASTFPGTDSDWTV